MKNKHKKKSKILYLEKIITLDALSASDLLLEQQEQQEKKQQGKSGLNRIKNNNYINSRNQTRSESSMDPFSPSPNSF